jgi:hypothetical protein
MPADETSGLLESIYCPDCRQFNFKEDNFQFMHQTVRICGPSLLLFLWCGRALLAQQTVFNVPSADVLDKGKIYGEFDFTGKHSDDNLTFTPRAVVGLGHHFEAGLNFNGMSQPWTGQVILSPTIKWRFYDGGNAGWSAFMGDDLFVPVHHAPYVLGNYTYAELARTVPSIRIAAGPFFFTRNVVAQGNKAGVRASLEDPVTTRLTVAADWFSGDHSNGYFDPGGLL